MKRARTTFGPHSLRCLTCGGEYVYDESHQGISITMLVAITKVFDKEHRRCRPGEIARKRFEFTTPDEWLASLDTGISSATIWSVMTGRPSPFQRVGTPSDPSDFGRCYRLLKAFPLWRRRLPEVAFAWPAWAALIASWDELTALFEEEEPTGTATKLYARLKELTAPPTVLP